jgi:hypothetical protein
VGITVGSRELPGRKDLCQEMMMMMMMMMMMTTMMMMMMMMVIIIIIIIISPYYRYTPANVLEDNDFNLYWNRSILTDKTITFNQPDTIL